MQRICAHLKTICLSLYNVGIYSSYKSPCFFSSPQFSYQQQIGGNYLKERLHFSKDINDNFSPINGKSCWYSLSSWADLFTDGLSLSSLGYIPSITATGSSLDCLNLIVQSINCNSSPTSNNGGGGGGSRTGSSCESQTSSSSVSCQFRLNNNIVNNSTPPSPT